MFELNSVTCIDALALCRALPEASVDLIATDPPYGLTACHWDVKVPLDAMWDAFKRIIKPRGAIVMTASQPFTSELVMSNRAMFKYEWIWDKSIGVNFLNAPYQPLKTHEAILVFSKSASTYTSNEGMYFYPQKTPGEPYVKNNREGVFKFIFRTPIVGGINTNVDGARYPKSIIRISGAIQNKKQHSTEKPVALFEYLIRTYTRPGDLVVDMFAGSGTTAIAARNTGRHFIVGDYLQEWVDVINRRLQAPFTPPLFTLDEPAPRAETLPLWEDGE